MLCCALLCVALLTVLLRALAAKTESWTLSAVASSGIGSQ
jgi:hypothetical protein